ncbi:competence protein CoiA [Kitasatospora sp. MAA19]|uniref:competence protein CoiA family protein n=1 Tax=Kitasatospora sp. MAA19 TaxID=3035090 RepID=UPI0024746D42|nr:competence protein CoiA family protein [Kitasatospora sp. MAA19]MDH6709845.1 competence protein CoiA [Kitasatospora sp. MAA19]
MAFTARHSQWGRLDATMADLGCGRAWSLVHRTRPRTPLVCLECGHGLHAKVSPRGLRFFAHDPQAPECVLAGESLEHHLLKLQLVTLVREAGWYGELEVRADDGSWRADVMAISPDGSKRFAWEAQLSPITIELVRERTDNLHRDGVRVCWVAPTVRPWLGWVPSIHVATPSWESDQWDVTSGIARLDTRPQPEGREGPPVRWWAPVSGVSLRDFVAWVLGERVVEHRLVEGVFNLPHATGGHWRAFWTTQQNMARGNELEEADREYAEQEARRNRLLHEQMTASVNEALEREKAEAAEAARRETRKAYGNSHSEIAETRKEALRQALDLWAATEGIPALQLVFGAGGGALYWAGGSAVLLDGRPYGTLMPAISLLGDLPADKSMVLFATSRTEERDLARFAPPGTKVVRLAGRGVLAVDGFADRLISGEFVTLEMEQRQRDAFGHKRNHHSRDGLLGSAAISLRQFRRAGASDFDSLLRFCREMGELVADGFLDQEATCSMIVHVALGIGWKERSADGSQDLAEFVRHDVATTIRWKVEEAERKKNALNRQGSVGGAHQG